MILQAHACLLTDCTIQKAKSCWIFWAGPIEDKPGKAIQSGQICFLSTYKTNTPDPLLAFCLDGLGASDLDETALYEANFPNATWKTSLF